jgi:hypothetical protein
MLRTDRIERGVLVRVLDQAAEYRRQLDDRLASMVIYRLSEAMKKGRGH